MSQPALIDCRARDNLEKAGAQTMHEKAMDKARVHQPTPLSNEVRSEMRSIVDNVEAEILEEKERLKKDKS